MITSRHSAPGPAVIQLTRESQRERRRGNVEEAADLAQSAVRIADEHLAGLYGQPEAHFSFCRALETLEQDEPAMRGYFDFGKRFGYQVWTPPLRLRAQSRLIAIGTRHEDQALVGVGIREGREMFDWVAQHEALVEYWHRIAIWAMETGQHDLARPLFRRCSTYRVQDRRFVLSPQLAAASLTARDDEQSGLAEFARVSGEALALDMVRATRVAGDHLAAALRN